MKTPLLTAVAFLIAATPLSWDDGRISVNMAAASKQFCMFFFINASRYDELVTANSFLDAKSRIQSRYPRAKSIGQAPMSRCQ